MDQMEETTGKLSSLQLELLKVYALNPTPQEMEDIRQMLGQYFGERLATQVGERAKQKAISERDLDRWLDEEA